MAGCQKKGICPSKLQYLIFIYSAWHSSSPPPVIEVRKAITVRPTMLSVADVYIDVIVTGSTVQNRCFISPE